MEKAVGELQGLQAQMIEFQTLQDSVVALFICVESQISRLERVESETEDEEQMEEKDQEPMIDQSKGPPLELVLPSTSHFASATVTDFVSSPAFNLTLCLSPIRKKSALSSPPSVSNVKGKVRIEAPPIVSYTTELPHPSAATMGTIAGTSSSASLGIGQLKLKGPARYFGGQKPSVRALFVEVERWMRLMCYPPGD